MPHAFNQIEPFEKPWFLIVPSKDDKTITYSTNDFLDNMKLLKVQVLFSSPKNVIWSFDFSWITPLVFF
jgi:hypothetical protein